MTWRQINGYQYPYRINEEAQVQKWDGKQWIDIRARISGNRAVVYLRTVEGKQYKAALVRLMDDAFWEGRAKRDGLHITHRNGVKLDCELRNLVAVKPGQAVDCKYESIRVVMQCKRCTVQTPISVSVRRARLAWNTRAPILSAEEMEMLEGME